MYAAWCVRRGVCGVVCAAWCVRRVCGVVCAVCYERRGVLSVMYKHRV